MLFNFKVNINNQRIMGLGMRLSCYNTTCLTFHPWHCIVWAQCLCCKLSMRQKGSEAQGHLWLPWIFEASLGCVKPVFFLIKKRLKWLMSAFCEMRFHRLCVHIFVCLGRLSLLRNCPPYFLRGFLTGTGTDWLGWAVWQPPSAGVTNVHTVPSVFGCWRSNSCFSEVSDGCELKCGYWELNLDPLQEAAKCF